MEVSSRRVLTRMTVLRRVRKARSHFSFDFHHIGTHLRSQLKARQKRDACSMNSQSPTKSSQMDVDSEIDPVWASSRTARQIYALGEVEKVPHTATSSRVDLPHTRPTGHQPPSLTRRFVYRASHIAADRWPRRRSPAGWRAVRTVRARGHRVLQPPGRMSRDSSFTEVKSSRVPAYRQSKSLCVRPSHTSVGLASRQARLTHLRLASSLLR